MRQAAAPGCFSDRPLSSRGRCTALPSRPVLPAVRPRRHAAQAAQPAGGQGAGGRGARRRRRESVTFLVPARADPDLTQPMRATHVTQRSLDNFLDKMNALGFYTARGGISRQLEDLPEGGTVQLFLSPVPSIAEQVRTLQQAFDDMMLAKQQQLAAFLRLRASEDSAGVSLTTLPSEPYKDVRGQDYVQLHAAVVAGNTLYVGEMQQMLGKRSVADLLLKLDAIRSAISRGSSPDLAAALRGVTHIKLYLAGEGLQAGLTVKELAELAVSSGMSLVLPSELDLMSPPSAVPL